LASYRLTNNKIDIDIFIIKLKNRENK